jgi:hypothetical protein
MLEFLLSFPEKNQAALNSEIKILKQDLNLLLRQIDQKNASDSASTLSKTAPSESEIQDQKMEILIKAAEDEVLVKKSHEEV